MSNKFKLNHSSPGAVRLGIRSDSGISYEQWRQYLYLHVSQGAGHVMTLIQDKRLPYEHPQSADFVLAFADQEPEQGENAVDPLVVMNPLVVAVANNAAAFTWNGFKGYEQGGQGKAGWYADDPFVRARGQLRKKDRVRVMELERDLMQAMHAVGGAVDDLLTTELKDKLAGNPLYGPARDAGRVDVMLLLAEDTHRSNTASINIKVPMSQNIYAMLLDLQKMRLGDVARSATYVKNFNLKIENMHNKGFNEERTAECSYLYAAIFLDGCLGIKAIENLHQRRGEGDIRLICAPSMTLEMAQGLLMSWNDLIIATRSRNSEAARGSASSGASSSTVVESVNQIGVGKKGKPMQCKFCPNSTNHYAQHCRAPNTTDEMRANAKAEFLASRSKKGKKG